MLSFRTLFSAITYSTTTLQSHFKRMVYGGLTTKLSDLTIKDKVTENQSKNKAENGFKSTDSRDNIVQKSDNDDCHYRVLTLDNGIRCLLISDSEATKTDNAALHIYNDISTTQKAAACLSVQVGSCQDPKTMPGLAHFLEHMLFMGCSKYPNESEYDDYLDHHGGSSNAHTDFEITSYVFDVSVDHFEGALDRFANQFISPLLKKGSVNREVNSVDSEWMESLQKDVERMEAIQLSLLQLDHPYNRFGAGNKKTLQETPRKQHQLDPLRVLQDFYQEYYSANMMVLCVESSDSLDKLESMIQVFSKIPNKARAVPSLEDHPLPKPRHSFVKYYPVKDHNKLFVDWFLPPQTPHYKSKPEDYIAWCVGHEGTGSLISKLKKEGLALSLEAGVSIGGFDTSSNFAKFNVTIVLSEQGLSRYEDVIRYLFQYLAMMRNHGPQYWIHEEIRRMYQIDWDYMEKDSPYDTVEDLCENMLMYPPEHYVSGPELLYEYSPCLIEENLTHMVPQKMCVMVMSKEFNSECKSIERWYRGQYKAGQITPPFLEELSVIQGGDFRLPDPNPYIPEDFEIRSVDLDGPLAVPVVISDEVHGKIWYHKDSTFEQPECLLYCHIFSAMLYKDIRTYALNVLYLACVSNVTEELFYPAEMAGLDSSLSPGADGWILTFGGYNDKMFKYFTTVLKEFTGADVTENEFTIVKESVVKDFRLAYLKPRKYARELRLNLLKQRTFSADEMGDVLESIELADLENYKMTDLGGFYIESLCGGNLTGSEVLEYMRHLQDTFNTAGTPLPRHQIPQVRVYKIPLGRWRHSVPNRNTDDLNTVVVNYYQHDVVRFRDTVLLDILQNFMGEPMFNQLRTRLQLGYNVSLSDHLTHGVTGFSLTVCSQANKYTAEEINSYMEKFLVWFNGYLVSMEEEDFRAKISSIMKDRLSPHYTVDEEMDQMWGEIVAQEYIFDRDMRIADILRIVTKGELLTFYHNLFFSNVRKLSIQVLGNPRGSFQSIEKDNDSDSSSSEDDSSSDDEDDEEEDVNIPHMVKLDKGDNMTNGATDGHTDISSIEDFHKLCTLVPVYKLVSEIVTKDVTNS